MLGVLLYHLGSFFSRILPGNIPQGIARIIGEVSWIVRFGTRRVIECNMRLIHGADTPRSELRRRARFTILNFAKCIQIFLELPSLDWEDLERKSDFSEFFAALERMDEPGPFVVATAHLGPWELGGYCLSRLGYPLHTVALDHPSRHVTQFFSERRALLGIHAYPLADSFPRLVEALKGGDCVALLVDRAYGRARCPAELFGVEKDFPLGHAILAVRCGVPVITGGIVLNGEGGFRYVHGSIRRPDPTLDEQERIEALQRTVLSDLEPIIRAHSEQWFHFRRLEPNRRKP